MKLKKHKDFLSEASYFDQYQLLKQLMYEINDYGKYNIYKENWYIYNDKKQKVGSYYMFIDNNRTLIIDKLDFDQNSNLASQYLVQSLPTILYFKDGQLKGRTTGMMTDKYLEAKVQSLL